MGALVPGLAAADAQASDGPIAGATAVVSLPSDLAVIDDLTIPYATFLSHVTSKNPSVDGYYARRLFESYFAECRREGVNLVVALSQMLHETDYLLFSGSVRAVQYNYAGLGATAPGAPGLRFPNMDTGVRGHVQHLKAYGDDEPLAQPLVDPRFHYVTRGSAPTVMSLTGRWATDPDYGPKVMAHAHRMLIGAND